MEGGPAEVVHVGCGRSCLKSERPTLWAQDPQSCLQVWPEQKVPRLPVRSPHLSEEQMGFHVSVGACRPISLAPWQF